MARKRAKVTRSIVSTNQLGIHLKNQQDATRTNRFDLLSRDMNVDTQPSTSSANASNIKPIKPPPVVIDCSSADFKKVLDHIGPNGYFFRRTSMGTKVFSDNMEKYLSLLKGLKSTEFRYYTHKIPDSSTYKMLLKGLHKVPTDLIKDELEINHGVKCLDIREVVTERTNASDALYLLTFNRMEVNKKVLHNIKYILRVSIFWKNQRTAPNKGPTQCRKCGLYGHGTDNCYRQKVCFLCSSITHDTDFCPMNNTSGGKIYKCFNCVSKGYTEFKHRADDPNCPCRANYIEARLKATQKNSERIQRGNGGNQTTITSDQQYFNVPKPNGNQTIPNYKNATYANQLKSKADLFSMDELFAIFRNATVELKKCSTKLDQLNIIVSLLKYAI